VSWEAYAIGVVFGFVLQRATSVEIVSLWSPNLWAVTAAPII